MRREGRHGHVPTTAAHGAAAGCAAVGACRCAEVPPSRHPGESAALTWIRQRRQQPLFEWQSLRTGAPLSNQANNSQTQVVGCARHPTTACRWLCCHVHKACGDMESRGLYGLPRHLLSERRTPTRGACFPLHAPNRPTLRFSAMAPFSFGGLACGVTPLCAVWGRLKCFCTR